MGPMGMATALASDLALAGITDLDIITTGLAMAATGLADITDMEAVTTAKSASGASWFRA